MESISSDLRLIEQRKAFPMGLTTAGSSVYGGWKLGDVFFFYWPKQAFKVLEICGGACAYLS